MRKLATAVVLAAAAGGGLAATASADPIVLDPSQLAVQRAATLFSKPNLSLAGARLDSATGRLTYSVANTGWVGVTDSVTRVSVTVVDRFGDFTRHVQTADVHTGAIARGQTRDYVVSLGGPVSPRAAVTITADAPGQIAELREDDNSLTIEPRLPF